MDANFIDTGETSSMTSDTIIKSETLETKDKVFLGIEIKEDPLEIE